MKNEAKDDSNGLKAILDLIDIREELSVDAQEICDILREDYLELLEDDIKKLKSMIRTSSGISIKKDGVKIEEPNNVSLGTLAYNNEKTQIINLFNEDIVRQCLIGCCCLNAEKEYNSLDEDNKNIYLNTLCQVLEMGQSGIDTISDIKKLCDTILNSGMAKTSEKLKVSNEKFIASIKAMIMNRQNPISDLITLYKIKIPRDYEFIYDGIIANFEERLNENDLGEISEEQIKELSLLALNNTRIQEGLTNLLEKKYTKMGLTTEQFIQEMPGDRDELSRQMWRDTEKEEHYLRMRAEAYIRSIQKSGDKVQKKMLKKLQKEWIATGEIIKTPQYISYQNLERIDGLIIIGIKDGSGFVATTLEGKELKTEREKEIKESQNKYKKGIRALFKKKSEKEPITETRILSEDMQCIQVLNKHETGRFQIVTLKAQKAKFKATSKEDVIPQDIGNNGALVLKKPIVDKIKVPYNKTTETVKKSFNRDSNKDR